MRAVLCAPLTELLVALLAALLVGVCASPPVVRGLREVRAVVGGRAEISCSADHMPPGVQLSWVRRPGLQVLWSGSLRFSGGSRVTARRAAHRHTLTVDLLRHSDAGLYECQLNTDPKASWTTRLIVLDEPDPELQLWAESEGVRVRESVTKDGRTEVILPAAGGELRCAGRGTLSWTKEGEEIQESSISQCPADPQCSVSVLAVAGAGAGQYSCSGGGGGSGNITVRVQDHPRTDESRWEDMLGDAAGAGARGAGVSSSSSLAGSLLITLVAIFL